MKKIFILLLTFIIVLNSFLVVYAQQAMNLEMGKFKLPDKWIYEGVTFSDDYATKRYTLITNLDVYILYGNRDLYEEIQKKMPIFSKEDIEQKLTTQNFAEIISGAAGSSCEEKLYGKNIFYEFEKAQQVKGTNKIVNSVIDMYFRDGYVHSFSYSYKTSKDNFQDYQNMLANFRLATDPEPETKTKAQETVKPVETTPPEVTTTEPTPATSEPVTNVPEVVTPENNNTEVVPENTTTEAPKENPTPVETTNNEPAPVENTEKTNEVEPIDKPEENILHGSATEITSTNLQDPEKTSEETNSNNNQVPNEIDAKPIEDEVDIINPDENTEIIPEENENNVVPVEENNSIDDYEYEHEEEIENVVPVTLSKSKPMAVAILGIPAVRDALIIFIIIDITIAILVRKHKKNKRKQAEVEKEEVKANNFDNANQKSEVSKSDTIEQNKQEEVKPHSIEENNNETNNEKTNE